MKPTTNEKRRIYTKPQIKKVSLDNVTSLYMMSENTIPDPPWVSDVKKNNDPYKTNQA